jgi:hypothetical protein
VSPGLGQVEGVGDGLRDGGSGDRHRVLPVKGVTAKATKVNRLGEFSLIGRLFSLGRFLNARSATSFTLNFIRTDG